MVRVAVSAVAAAMAAVLLWVWWVSFDRPVFVPRSHFVSWSVVRDVAKAEGTPVLEASENYLNIPVLRYSALLAKRYGTRLSVLTAPQLPFMVLLIFSCALIAWRIGGPAAGAVAPWIAAFAPMTVGLAVSHDELLTHQALAASAVAAVLWSQAPGRWWVGAVSVGAAVMGVRWSSLTSAGLMFLAITAMALAGVVFWSWRRRIQERRGAAPENAWRAAPGVATVWATVAFAAGLAASLPFPTDYLVTQATRESFTHLSVTANHLAIFACPSVWFFNHAGPVLAVCALGALPVLWRNGKGADAIPLLFWLGLPMVLLTVIPKRHEFYFVAATPAAYILPALGIAAWRKDDVRRIVRAAVLAALFGSWMLLVSHQSSGFLRGKLSAMFEGIVYPYLHSPFSEEIFTRPAAGDMVADVCGTRGLPVLIADRGAIGGEIGFEIWRRSPRTPIGSLKVDPFFPPEENHCLVFSVNVTEGPEPILDRLFDAFERDRYNPELIVDPAAVDEHLRRVKDVKDQYVFVGEEYNYYLFITRDALFSRPSKR
ncbi:MAG: hypothetical protein M5R36_11895 [Deltaproteobacteria bacterium]|nr:hypothetical protein [Deltaproteobacteria bacterium]